MSLLLPPPPEDGVSGVGTFDVGEDDGGGGGGAGAVVAVSRDATEGFGLFRPKKIPALTIKAQMTATDGHNHRSSAG
jgi:hypothetical protein